MAEFEPKYIQGKQVKRNGLGIPGGRPVNASIEEVGRSIKLREGRIGSPINPVQEEWASTNKARGSE